MFKKRYLHSTLFIIILLLLLITKEVKLNSTIKSTGYNVTTKSHFFKIPPPMENASFCSDVKNCHNFASCLSCNFPKNCTYGEKVQVSCIPLWVCKIKAPVKKMMSCKYCYQTKYKIEHDCAEVRNCSSSSVRLVRTICRAKQTTYCLGRRVFYQNVRCHWTNGYSWKKTFLISVLGGGFGAERFYLGYWKSGLAKLVSFGGLGIWTSIDLVLVALGYLGPADGSLYV
uniref:TM2 domain-containing protein n=1 Tax=Parastrongyloides trichosuri TaxID=131310 RepID=A0A0N4ZY52_PARTI